MKQTVPFKDGRKQLIAGADTELARTKMETQPGATTYGFAIKVEATVAASGAVQLTATQRDNVLKAFLVTFIASHSLKLRIPTFQDDSLYVLRDDCKRLLQRDYEGVEDTTSGLAYAFSGAGSKTLVFTAYIPASYAAFIKGARKVMGLGYNQMKDSSIQVKLGPDPFSAQTTGVMTLSSCFVTFSPLFERGHERVIGLPIVAERLVAPKSKLLETEPGFMLSIEQLVALADTQLGDVEVTIGGFTATRDNTPAAIQAEYEAQDDTHSLPKGIKARRAPLYVLPPTEFAKVKGGAASIVKKTTTEEYEVRAVYVPYLTTDQILALVAAEAATLPAGQAILAVSAAVYDGVDANEEQLPLSGYVCLTNKDPDFYSRSGVLVRSGEERGEVYIPPDKLATYGRRMVQAMKPSQRFPKGDLGSVESIRQEAGWEIPGFNNHPSGLAYTSWVAEEVNRQLDEAAAEAEQLTKRAESVMAGQRPAAQPAAAQPAQQSARRREAVRRR